MKTPITILALTVFAASASAAVLSVAGNDTLIGNRPANLIVNGSFEADGGVVPNGSYWATGTGFSPTMSLTSWTASGQGGSYAIWGNDGLGGIKNSAAFPHGTNGLYFGGSIMASVTPYPIEATDGQVSFASTPTITPKPTGAPVTLEQTVSGLNPSSTYVLDFWTSGEDIGQPTLPVDGFFGVDITGESRLYFAAPSGNGPIGTSQRYQVYFKPTAPTITFKWINWGHYFNATNALSDELVLDDVILNQLSNSNAPLDCSCLTNITMTCPGVVPDLCALFAPCFGTNIMPGSCTQNFPPGMQFSVGTYPLTLQVMDLQSNIYNCVVQFTVLPQVPVPPLTMTCPTNKTVECGSGWSFDSPIILSSCCGVTVTSSDVVLSNAPCGGVIERNWQIMDGCGNVKNCSQVVTTVDTTPPGTQCGANLVPNPSFERYTSCPNAISLFDYAAPWFTPTDATSDLFSPCAGPTSFVGTPTNFGGVQTPLTGQTYAGAVVWTTYGLNTNNTYRDYREYLEVPLLAPLIGGQRYQVSFHVSRADNYRYAVAELGAYFSKLPLQTNGFYQNFPVVPQLENSPTNMLTDTNGWMLVSGIFVANGSENFLTIGNFRTDANTTYTNINPGGPTPDYAYYYFDDVSVIMLCDPITNKVVQCGDPWEFDFSQQMAFDNCSGMNVTVNTTTTTNGYCPRVIQRDWELTDACGNTNFLTQTVTIVDTNPPLLMCTGGANLVPNPQFENKAYCPYFFSQVTDAAPWFNPTVATPDYMNTCATFAPVSIPNNLMGNQTAFSGDGYMGAFAYSVYGTNPVPGYREYIEAPLLAPLQPGTMYQVSFYVSLADTSGWAIANLGAHLSVGPLLNGAIQGPLNAIPQIANPPGNLLTNKTGWTLIQGTYTATGGEDHLTLGNFLSDALTAATTTPTGTNHTYYYYDDISVMPLCSFTNKTVACGTAWEFDTPLAYDVCSADYVSVFITSTTTSSTCPKVHTRVWTIYDACNNSMTATQMVTEVDTVPPMLLCSGINLVPNPSFEDTWQCAPAPSYLDRAKPWYLPTVGSADLFNPCAALNSGASVPTNMFGSQTAFAGQNYAGGYVYAPGGAGTNSQRECFAAQLIAPLIAGQSYAVSFRVSRADNCAWAIAEIGAHFSVGSLTNWPGSYLAAIPQIVNPSANIITSATNWTLISGVFTATGGEDNITLGNFRTDANTTASFIGGVFNAGYYYYDDVKVIAQCTNVPVKTVACGAPWNFDPAPIGVDLCSGSNVTVTLTSTITNSLCPLNAVRTWTLTDACGNATNWSQTVTVAGGGSLVVNCGCLQDTSLNLLTTNGCSGVIPNLSILSNSPCIVASCGSVNITQNPAAGTVVGPGYHPITLTITSCGGGGTNICELPFFVNAPQPVVTCPTNIYVQACSNSVVVNFSVSATGTFGPVVCSPPSGSSFPIGTNAVTCVATSSCGGITVTGFYIIVRPVSFKFGCYTKVIHIITYPPPSGRIIYLPDFPGGGSGVDFADLNGTEGVRFDLGAAEKFTFSTVLDFNAPADASFGLASFNAANGIAEPLLHFQRSCQPHCGWNVKLDPQIVGNPAATFRSIAIGTNGELFSSFTDTAASLETNILANLAPMNGATQGVMTVTIDCRTREITLEFPSVTWTPDNARKGWDGCIYGNGPRGSNTNKTARLILTPLTTVPPPPITLVDLVVSNLTTMAFDNPSLTMSGRKWNDGHVTIMKAFDDGAESGMEFYSLGAGGGVNTELGHAESFSFYMTSLDTNGLPPLEQQFAIRGWPPGTTTNRPPPPIINLRLTPDASGLGGVELGAEFVDWGVSNVTVKLWNGTTLVAETNHIPATLASTLITLGGFPGILSCPDVGVVSLSDTNPIIVLEGLPCGSGVGCIGTELRILAEPTAAFTPPTAFTELSVTIGEDMDYLIHRLQTTPACSPVPLQATTTPEGIGLDWQGDDFRLQGAETLNGKWYDLGVNAPVTLPANSSLRLFRLICD